MRLFPRHRTEKFSGLPQLAVLMAALLYSPHADAGVWIRARDSMYAQLTYSQFRASQNFDPDGELAPVVDERFMGETGGVLSSGRFTGQELSAYVEYGLGRSIEAFGYIPLRKSVNRWEFADGDNPALLQSNLGAGDLLLGLRTGRQRGRVVYAVSIAGRAPLYDNAREALNMAVDNQDFYDDNPPLGPGTMDLDLSVSAGTSFGAIPGWTLIEAGVQARNRDYATLLPGRLQVGYKILENLPLMFNTQWAFALDDGKQPDEYRNDNGKGPLIIDRQMFIKMGLETAWFFKEELGVTVGVTQIIWGRRTAFGTTGYLGLAYNK